MTGASLATTLRALREAAGLSQEELAERAGLSSHAISALERGTRTRPYPHTVRALCDALDADAASRAALIASVPARGRSTHAPSDSAVPPRTLPMPATSLLGREHDLERAVALVAEHRLVTLTGMGGVGKTRMALAVAVAVQDRFADGVAFVDLAPLRSADEVLPSIADAVDAHAMGTAGVTSAIVERLHGQRTLLVLDNVEHLLEVAPRIAALVETAPGLTVLATSRAPLRIRGEIEVAVEPLAVPGNDNNLSGPAASLLLERAQAVNPGWGTAPEDQPAVAAVCLRLAGIPLALELAAVRARLLDPGQLLDRLDVALLAGARDLPERQRTMRATLDWSYGLLTVEEQRLLRLLSVFVGGFQLEDAESVVALTGGLSGHEVLDVLQALSEQSLVVGTRGRRRRLAAATARTRRAVRPRQGEGGRRVAERCRRPCSALPVHRRAVGSCYRDGRQVEALARIDLEHPNLAAAIERSLGCRRRHQRGAAHLGVVDVLVAARPSGPRTSLGRERTDSSAASGRVATRGARGGHHGFRAR